MPGVETRTLPGGKEVDVEYDFAEIVYENGEHSISPFFQDDAGKKLFVDGLKEHHERAKKGLPSGPPVLLASGEVRLPDPAVRIAKVFIYPDHPAIMSAPERATEADIRKYLTDALKNLDSDEDKTYSIREVFDRAVPKPLIASGPHESNYPAAEKEELDPALWGGDK